VFPNAEDAPPKPAQFAVHAAVTVAVTGDLCIPKFTVGFRAAKAAGTTVPEAAVHKDSQPVPPKEKVRLAEDILVPPPTGNAVLAKQFYQCQLGVLIAMTTNPGHDIGTLGLCENITHFGSQTWQAAGCVKSASCAVACCRQSCRALSSIKDRIDSAIFCAN
jgi:hypothetical protein